MSTGARMVEWVHGNKPHKHEHGDHRTLVQRIREDDGGKGCEFHCGAQRDCRIFGTEWGRKDDNNENADRVFASDSGHSEYRRTRHY